MTEEQAKTKWCPQARITTGDGSSGNRHILSIDGMNGADRCIASACMAWRLLPDQPEYVDLPAEQVPEGDGWTRDGDGLEAGEHAWTRVISNRGGYCGLAGHQS